jgi:ADP-L-glycero-D-manno-heptose 6-epimerase
MKDRHIQSSGVYNSGTGEARTFTDLAEAVFAALGHEPAIRFIDTVLPRGRGINLPC